MDERAPHPPAGARHDQPHVGHRFLSAHLASVPIPKFATALAA
jgi:hypothetical protein